MFHDGSTRRACPSHVMIWSQCTACTPQRRLDRPRPSSDAPTSTPFRSGREQCLGPGHTGRGVVVARSASRAIRSASRSNRFSLRRAAAARHGVPAGRLTYGYKVGQSVRSGGTFDLSVLARRAGTTDLPSKRSRRSLSALHRRRSHSCRCSLRLPSSVRVALQHPSALARINGNWK